MKNELPLKRKRLSHTQPVEQVSGQLDTEVVLGVLDKQRHALPGHGARRQSVCPGAAVEGPLTSSFLTPSNGSTGDLSQAVTAARPRAAVNTRANVATRMAPAVV